MAQNYNTGFYKHNYEAINEFARKYNLPEYKGDWTGAPKDSASSSGSGSGNDKPKSAWGETETEAEKKRKAEEEAAAAEAAAAAEQKKNEPGFLDTLLTQWGIKDAIGGLRDRSAANITQFQAKRPTGTFTEEPVYGTETTAMVPGIETGKTPTGEDRTSPAVTKPAEGPVKTEEKTATQPAAPQPGPDPNNGQTQTKTAAELAAENGQKTTGAKTGTATGLGEESSKTMNAFDYLMSTLGLDYAEKKEDTGRQSMTPDEAEAAMREAGLNSNILNIKARTLAGQRYLLESTKDNYKEYPSAEAYENAVAERQKAVDQAQADMDQIVSTLGGDSARQVEYLVQKIVDDTKSGRRSIYDDVDISSRLKLYKEKGNEAETGYLGNVVAGGLENSAAGIVGMERAMYEGGVESNTAKNVIEPLNQAARELAQAKYYLQDVMKLPDDNALKADDLAQAQQRVDEAQRKVDAYTEILGGSAARQMDYIINKTVDDMKSGRFDWGKATDMVSGLKLDKADNAMNKAVQATDEMQAAMAENSAKLIEEAKKQAGGGFLGNLATDVAVNLIQMAGDAALALITLQPGMGLLSMGGRVYGSSAEEAQAMGMDVNQQNLYGAVKGGISMASEKLTGAFESIYGKGITDRVKADIAGRIAQRIGTEADGKVAKALTALFTGFGEGDEEILEWFGGMLADAAFGVDKNDQPAAEELGDVAYDWLVASLIGIGGGAANAAVQRNGVAVNENVDGINNNVDTEVNTAPEVETTPAAAAAARVQETETPEMKTQRAKASLERVMANGYVSNQQANMIISDPVLRAEYEAKYGKLSGTKKQMRDAIKLAANPQAAVTEGADVDMGSATQYMQNTVVDYDMAKQDGTLNSLDTARLEEMRSTLNSMGRTQDAEDVDRILRDRTATATNPATEIVTPKEEAPAATAEEQAAAQNTEAGGAAEDSIWDVLFKKWERDEAQAPTPKANPAPKTQNPATEIVTPNTEAAAEPAAQKTENEQQNTAKKKSKKDTVKRVPYEKLTGRERNTITDYDMSVMDNELNDLDTETLQEMYDALNRTQGREQDAARVARILGEQAGTADAQAELEAEEVRNPATDIIDRNATETAQEEADVPKSENIPTEEQTAVSGGENRLNHNYEQTDNAQQQEEKQTTIADLFPEQFGGQQAQTQSVVHDQLTEEEAQRAELNPENDTHTVHGDREIDEIVDRRMNSYGAETARADLMQKDAKDWTDVDVRTAEVIMEKEFQDVRNMPDGAEKDAAYKRLAELKNKFNEEGTAHGQALRQRQRLSAPAEIVAEAANTLYGEQNAERTRNISDQKKTEIMDTVTDFSEKIEDLQNRANAAAQNGTQANAQNTQSAGQQTAGQQTAGQQNAGQQNGNGAGNTAQNGTPVAQDNKQLTQDLISLIEQIGKYRHTNGIVFNERLSGPMKVLMNAVGNGEGGNEFLLTVATGQTKMIANDFTKRTAKEKISALHYSNMLSNIATAARNFIANPVLAATETASNNAGVLADKALSLGTGTRSMAFDWGALSPAAWKGGTQAFARSVIAEGVDAGLENEGTEYAVPKGYGGGRTFRMKGGLIERVLSTFAKYQDYALKSTDEFSKGFARAETQRGLDALEQHGKITAQAKQQLQNRAQYIAEERTLQKKDGVAGVVGKAVNSFDEQVAPGSREALAPFVEVPMNGGAMMTRYLPGSGLLTEIADVLVAHKENAKTGAGLTADQQAKIATQLGRIATGTSMVVLSAALAMDGIITNSSDDKDKAALEKTEGKSGTQLNVDALLRFCNGEDPTMQEGDRLMNLGYLETLNPLMNMGVAVAEGIKAKDITDANELGQILAQMGDMNFLVEANFNALKDSYAELPVVSQIGAAKDAFTYSDADTTLGKLGDAAVSMGGQIASGYVVPNVVRGAARGLDEYERDTSGDTAAEGVLNYIKSGVPGLRETLPVKQNAYGERVAREKGLLGVLNATVLPGEVKTYTPREQDAELERLSTATGKSAYPDRSAPKALTLTDGTKADLTQEQRRDYQVISGGLLDSMTKELFNAPYYELLTDNQKMEALDDITSYCKAYANTRIGSKYGIDVKASEWAPLMNGVDKPGTSNDMTALDAENVVKYVAYRTGLNEAVDNEDYAVIDDYVSGYAALPKNVQTVVSERMSGTGIKHMLEYADMGLGSESYFRVKDGISLAQEQLDANSTSSGGVEFLGLINADIPESEKKTLIRNGYLTKGRTAVYNILSKYNYNLEQVYDFYESADYTESAEKGGISNGKLSNQEVAYALSQQKNLNDTQRNEIFNAMKAALSDFGNDWGNYSYQSEVNYIRSGRCKYQYGRSSPRNNILSMIK